MSFHPSINYRIISLKPPCRWSSTACSRAQRRLQEVKTWCWGVAGLVTAEQARDSCVWLIFTTAPLTVPTEDLSLCWTPSRWTCHRASAHAEPPAEPETGGGGDAHRRETSPNVNRIKQLRVKRLNVSEKISKWDGNICAPTKVRGGWLSHQPVRYGWRFESQRRWYKYQTGHHQREAPLHLPPPTTDLIRPNTDATNLKTSFKSAIFYLPSTISNHGHRSPNGNWRNDPVWTTLSGTAPTCRDAHAVGFLFANAQHLLVDVTDHSPRSHRPVLLLCRGVRLRVLPGWSLHWASHPPPLLLLLKTNVLQETEGDVAWEGGWGWLGLA